MIKENTTALRNWLPQLAALMWIVLLTMASYNRCMVDGQQADVLLNTVMSQQHLSLFAWGQNRLLNFLPFLTSPVSNIPANVFLVTWLPGAFLAGFLWGATHLLGKVEGEASHESQWATTGVFVIGSSIFFSLVSRSGAFDLFFAHVEYTASIFLVGGGLLLL